MEFRERELHRNKGHRWSSRSGLKRSRGNYFKNGSGRNLYKRRASMGRLGSRNWEKSNTPEFTGLKLREHTRESLICF